MAEYEPVSLRNVAIAGHGGTGKTSLCESLLFVTGKSERFGKVDDETSCMDFEPEEQKRHISISAALNYVTWERHKINIIDTPGDSNFVFDIKNCLSVVDGAVILVDAASGVEFQTEKVWEYAEELNLPKIVYINKMDRERAGFFNTVDSIKNVLTKKATPICLPVGAEDSFKGIVDLLEMRALIFDGPEGKFRTEDIPEDMLKDAGNCRETMIEDIAECDDELMNKYLEGEELTLDDLKAGLKKGVISGDLIPVICGSAIKNIGSGSLIDTIVGCIPSPADRGPIAGKRPGTDDIEERLPEAGAPFSGMVFKTIADPYAGKLTLFRVYSGTVNSDFIFHNPLQKTSERFGNIFFLEGKNQKPAESLIPGDIAAAAKLKETFTGDTICDAKAPILFEKISPAPPVMSFAVHPKSKVDEEKIMNSINRLVDEDPALSTHTDTQTKEIILSGMGQIHIETTIEKLKRKFGVGVDLTTPRIPYKETIKGKTKVQGKYKKQSGGRGQYGDTWIEIEPLPRGQGFEFADKIVGGAIPKQYIPAVEKGVVGAMEEGVIAGYPVVDIKVTLFDGTFHTVDSSEMAFKIAGSMGFKKGVMECQPMLLEPITDIAIEIPDEYMGDVMGDLSSRRGKVMGMDTSGSNQIIKGQIPLAEILMYAPDLRSMTSGRGTFTYKHSHYEEVPPVIAEKIIAESKKEG